MRKGSIDMAETENEPAAACLRCRAETDLRLFRAADVGKIADLAARELTADGAGKMFCLAGIGGRVSGIMATTAAAAGYPGHRRLPVGLRQEDAGTGGLQRSSNTFG